MNSSRKKTSSKKKSRAKSQVRKTAKPVSRSASKKKSSAPKRVRLNKFLADSGLASRRKAEEFIKDGDVRVNGHVVSELSQTVDPFRDIVKLKNKTIKPVASKKYYMFNKPKGVVTSMSDPQGRPCIADYLKKYDQRLFPVGRLDYDTEGLLLISNDGEFAHEITHPSKHIPKVYLAKVTGDPSMEKLSKLTRGVTIVGGKAKALLVEKVRRGAGKHAWVKIIIDEGRNRQVRRMFEKIGLDVKKLQRVAIGQLTLGKLPKGQIKELTSIQLLKIFKIYEPREEKTKLNRGKKKKSSTPTRKKKRAKKQSKRDYFKKLNRKARK